jgi:capsular polysaccharide biosynthesis protein
MNLFSRLLSDLLRGAAQRPPRSVETCRAAMTDAASRNDMAELRRTALWVLGHEPDDPEALEQLGIALFAAGDEDGALELFVQSDRARFGAGVQTRLCVNSLLDPERAARGEPYVHVLEDVLVDSEFWIVIDGERAYSHETFDAQIANSPFVRRRTIRRAARFVTTITPPRLSVDEPCVLLGGDHNYAHWVSRNLLKLALIDGQEKFASLRMLVNRDLRRHQLEYLQLLGIPLNRFILVPGKGMVRCRRLIVPTLTLGRPRMHVGIDWLRRRMSALLAPEEQARDLIFLSRRDSRVRVLLNEDELIRALEPLGFRVIVAGEMSVREQIEAFSQARVVVGAHGAGLTNLVFAPSCAFVLEIVSGRIVHMGEFKFIAGQRGQTYSQIVSEDYGPERDEINRMHSDYRVDVAAVVKTLRDRIPELLA